jgi:GNAT superfamily N-acetyltransferase
LSLSSISPEWKGLSRYGKTNPAEAHAETFADWVLTGGRSDNAATRHYAEWVFDRAEVLEPLAAAAGATKLSHQWVYCFDGPNGGVLVTKASDGVQFHLQGQHDQSTHGNRGGAGGGLPDEFAEAPPGYIESAQAEWAAGAAYLAENEMPDWWAGLDYIGEDGLPVGENGVGTNYEAEDIIERMEKFREEVGPEVDAGISMIGRAAEERRREEISRVISMNELGLDEASERYGRRAKADRGEWQDLPPTLYHATSALGAISADGALKTRREIGGRDSAAGLGGGTDNTISFTSDRKIADGIARSLHEAHRALNIPKDQFLTELRERSGEWWPRVEELNRSVYGERSFDSLEDRFNLYRTFAAERERRDGILDPLFFNVNAETLRDMNPADIGIVEVMPAVEGAKGYQVSALGEWRTPTGAATEITRYIETEPVDQFTLTTTDLAVEVFHLQGEHDQQSHAGGRAKGEFRGTAAARTQEVADRARQGLDPAEFDGPLMSRGIAITVDDDLKKRIDEQISRGPHPDYPDEFNQHLEIGPDLADQLLDFEGHQGMERSSGFGQSWTTREEVAESVHPGPGQNLVVKVVGRPRQSDVLFQEVDDPGGPGRWVDAEGNTVDRGGRGADMLPGEMEVRVDGTSPIDIVDVQIRRGSRWESVWGDERGFGAGADELYRQFPHLLDELSTETFHLQGQHDQKDHGRRGGATGDDWEDTRSHSDGTEREERAARIYSGTLEVDGNSYQIQLDSTRADNAGVVKLEGRIIDPTRRPRWQGDQLSGEVGKFQRTITPGGTLKNDVFIVNEEYRRKGIGSAFLDQTEAALREEFDLKAIEVAAVEDGRYAWAARGYGTSSDGVETWMVKANRAVSQGALGGDTVKKAQFDALMKDWKYRWENVDFVYPADLIALSPAFRDSVFLAEDSPDWRGVMIFDDDQIGRGKQRVARLATEVFHLQGQHDQKDHGRRGGRSQGEFEPITAAEKRGNSRPVTADEFQRLAAIGQKQIDELAADTQPIGLDENWSEIQQDAFNAAQESWGGATINARTGEFLASDADLYALTVKESGMETVTVPENASQAEFEAAMTAARDKFRPVLERRDHYLGVFHDDDLNRIDFDPVTVVDSLDKVETIGAATRAIGGAYNFADGNGYWPPHVDEDAVVASASMGSMGDEITKFKGPAEWKRQAKQLEGAPDAPPAPKKTRKFRVARD